MFAKLADRVSYFYMIRYGWRFSPDRRRLLLIYVLEISAHLLWLTDPIFIGKAVAAIAIQGGDTLRPFLFWLLLAAFVALIGGALHWKGRIYQRRYAFALRQVYEGSLYWRLLSFSWAWHQTNHSGDTLNRVRSASSALTQFASDEFRYIDLFTGLIGSVALLLFLAPGVGLIVGLSIPAMLALLRHYDIKAVRFSKEWFAGENRLSAGLSDYIGNIATVLSLRLAGPSEKELLRRMDDIVPPMHGHIDATQGKWFAFGRAERIISLTALITYYMLHHNGDRAVLIATMVSMIQYLKRVTDSTSSLIDSYNTLTQAQIAMRAVEDIVQVDPAEGGEDRTMPWSQAEITGLHFHYEDQTHQLHHLDDVALGLARGRRIALVGASGSGKSTLLRLLRGLHTPTSGTLAIDGVVQPDFTALAAVATLIPQDAEIFENTLRYNIAFGVAASDEDLQPVVAMACLGPVIGPLPHRLDTDIRERGVNLSGGQKQRLALARGLFAARGSSLLLLDEPTSSLDPITEAEVLGNILAGLPDACIVAAIHRLHLLDRFDHIYVMAEGRVVEQGTLTELLALEGTLARLWEAQKREESE